MEDWERAKVLLEDRSLKKETDFAINTAKEIENTKEKLNDFLNSIILISLLGADLFCHDADDWDIIYKINDYKIIFKRSFRGSTTWLPNLVLKYKGKKLLDFSFVRNENNTKLVIKKIWKIDYNRFNLITDFTKELKRKIDKIEMRVV